MIFFVIMKSFFFLFSTLCFDVVWCRADSCTGEKNEFHCVTRTDFWERDCVSNEKVCDGFMDCPDGSDEWRHFCRHLTFYCTNRKIRRFDCISFVMNSPNVTSHALGFNVTGVEKGVKDKVSGVNTPGNRSRDAELNATLYFSTLKCLPLSKICDGVHNCRLYDYTIDSDEDNCECYLNPDCIQVPSLNDAGDTWWLRILGTTIGVIVVFGFCVCAAVQWEKRRTEAMIRRRDQQRQRQMEALYQRHTPFVGEDNRGMSYDPTEFSSRCFGHLDGAAVTPQAPPPYVAALDFPKPSAPADEPPPPPYDLGWIPAAEAAGAVGIDTTSDNVVRAPAATSGSTPVSMPDSTRSGWMSNPESQSISVTTQQQPRL